MVNITDIVVIGILAALIFLALRRVIINKKSGKPACGCCGSCANCPHASACHFPTKDELENTGDK